MTEAQWNAQKQFMLYQASKQIDYWDARTEYWANKGGYGPESPYYGAYVMANSSLRTWQDHYDAVDAKVYPESLT